MTAVRYGLYCDDHGRRPFGLTEKYRAHEQPFLSAGRAYG